MCVLDADVPTPHPDHTGTPAREAGRESPKITAWDLITSAISPSPPPPSCFSSRPPVAAPASHPPRHLDVPNARATAVAPRPPRAVAQTGNGTRADKLMRCVGRRHHHQGQNGGNAKAMHCTQISTAIRPSSSAASRQTRSNTGRRRCCMRYRGRRTTRVTPTSIWPRHRLHRPSRRPCGARALSVLCCAHVSRLLGCPRRFPSKRRPSRPSARGATSCSAQQLVRARRWRFCCRFWRPRRATRHAVRWSSLPARNWRVRCRSSSMACGHPSHHRAALTDREQRNLMTRLYTSWAVAVTPPWAMNPRRVRSYSDLVAPLS